MGADVTGVREAVERMTSARLIEESPFVSSPDDTRVLYLWPLWVEEQDATTQRPTPWRFEKIPGREGAHLAR